MQQLLFKGMLMGMTIAMADQGGIDNGATQAIYRAYLKDLIQGEVPGVDVTPEQAEEIAKYLREQEAPPPLCIEDGVDADVIAYMKSVDAPFDTDEEGRVIALGIGSDSNSPSLNAILPRLASLRAVREANISESFASHPSEPLTDDGFQAIAGWTELTCLDVNVHSLTGRGFERLARQNPLEHLTILRVGHLHDADLAVEAIKVCEALRELGLSSCEVSDAGLPHLAHLNDLKDLDLNYTKITGKGLIHLRPCDSPPLSDSGGGINYAARTGA